VLGNEESLKEETFGNKVSSIKYQITKKDRDNDTKYLIQDTHKEYPQYTRPENFMGQKVPKVLLGGDHKKIEEWRKKKSK
jgi:tRNA (guanine-N1)-methyltransferase